MCSPETLSRLTGRIANVAPALRYFWGTTRAERIRLRERAVQQLTLCTFAGDRVGETVALQPGEVCSGPYGNFVYIYDGKTKSARRAVHVEHIGESPALSLSPLVDGQLPEKERSVAMRLRRLLAKLMPLSLHDLRRSRAWAALVKALEQVYPSGSLVEFLATLARQYGHCSLITFLHSYVGGMLAKLALPPIDWRCVRWISPVKNLRGRIPELLRLYDGSAHAIDQLQAQVKRTRAHKRGNGIGTSRCWIGEHRFRVQHLRWCDSRSGAVVWPKPLPDRPDLPEFWIAIGEMKEIADARGVSLLFTVRVKTRDKHRDRFASLLGPDCFAGGV